MDNDVIARALALGAGNSAKLALKVIADFPFGLKYKGEVDYADDLPTNAQVGDAYTIKYKGSKSAGGTDPDGREFAWNGQEWKLIGASDKQDKLTPGDGINITENNVIKIDEEYTATVEYVNNTIGDINTILENRLLGD